MLERFIVSRKVYDKDMNGLRTRIDGLQRELRQVEKEKGEVEQSLALSRSETGGLEYEVEKLRERLDRAPKERDLQDYMSPIPEGETGRREYVAQIAGFFEGGLRDKLNYMHNQFRNQTGMFPLTERETDFFRACINVVGLLLDWGEECVNEHRSNIAAANNKDTSNVFEEDEAIENIKRTVT